MSGYVALNAFSHRVKKEIKERDKTCQAESGQHIGLLEAAHYNHNRSYPQYNSPENGRLLCTLHHLQDHQERSDNGLSESQNDWAINALKGRLLAYVSELITNQCKGS